ncbi:putative tRNA delta(2)-isopentenylpyrophosphate transferase (IPP transferase) (Isopentenyl-diphosphate:tRNA isopentenyltransferase) (IPTase) (IPPT) (fragment) [Candidatus Glomeribacter gigasporarum BEG34]|uniref:tRNA dimethylallyltransferase n=1 Tax=Candidatus Glomeribacter gigasporarum BEG34 TaxID=1070319 RepID=G2JC28_9BURK
MYRGLDIGTAKPDADLRARAPHHLIDVVEPEHAYSAARFGTEALKSIQDIHARGARPLLVGGAMLYYKALIEGLNPLPPANAAVRAALAQDAARAGWPALHARLTACDPALAARIAPHDAQRIQRALEVWMLTGQPMSALLARPRAASASEYRFIPITLEPSDRSVLHARIAARFDAMLERGLIDEVMQLRAQPSMHAALPSMRCVGYRQVWVYLEGAIDRAAMRDQGIFATRQLAKRQLTWCRALAGRRVIDCCAPDAVQQAAAIALQSWDSV